MNDKDRDKILYKPIINIKKKNVTQYSDQAKYADLNDLTLDKEAKAVENTDVLNAYSEYNPISRLKKINELLNNLPDMLSKFETNLPDEFINAVKNNDNEGIDTLMNTLDNIDEDIYPELYYIANRLMSEINKFLDDINEMFFGSLLNMDELDRLNKNIIDNTNELKDIELNNGKIDYKKISIDTLINKFINDRLDIFIEDYYGLKLINDKPPFDYSVVIPNNIMTQVYNENKKEMQNNLVQSDIFINSNIISNIMENINKYKELVLNNRKEIQLGTEQMFKDRINHYKYIEDKLTHYIIDLYSANLVDSVYKGKCRDSLLYKYNIKELYKNII